MDADKFENALNYKPISASIGRYRRLNGLTIESNFLVYLFQRDIRHYLNTLLLKTAGII